MAETTVASPRTGFFGAILGENDEEDKPKPPVPPIGKTIQPLVVVRPLPKPIAAPSVPPLVEVDVTTDAESDVADDEGVEEVTTQEEIADEPQSGDDQGAEEVVEDEASAETLSFNAPVIDSDPTDDFDVSELSIDQLSMKMLPDEEDFGDEGVDTLTLEGPDTDLAANDEPASMEPISDESAEEGQANEAETYENGDDSELAEIDDDSIADIADAPEREAATVDVQGEAVPEKQWSREMLDLRNAIRATYAVYEQPLSTQVIPPGGVIDACMAFGSKAELLVNSRSRQRVNAIGALCWNYPCAGKTLLVANDGNVMPRIGHGYQSKRGELLAALALSAVSTENEIRIGEAVGTVADLVEWEQTSVRTGADLSLTLIGLSTYLGADASWTNAAGEEWSLDRIAGEELSRKVAVTDRAAVDRLMGLTRYVVWARKHDVPRTGRHLQVERYIARFHDHALQLQGRDGSWGPLYFGYRGGSVDPTSLTHQLRGTPEQESLYCTGNILLWLTMSLSPDQLQSPELVRAVIRVNNGLASQRQRANLSTFSPYELTLTMRALRAIAEYDRRVFVADELSTLALK
ncbi:hypothetical protein [Aporhodopirellula aestuarii]|uniref:Uncharacterized protein n=1 Tax=Aporhodopirellula aestuarii TaxID=2950107 RepID=A0ABT0U5E5_9BACT|nr:hypothetical protein [Aporhodopirellula aestuarii]MCM2372134.1 hypothetical protein [Aporhodopirellula aestuarii]